jgi:hypothetical protein
MAAGESEELARLRRENAQLKREAKELAMERDVLKRCMGAPRILCDRVVVQGRHRRAVAAVR